MCFNLSTPFSGFIEWFDLETYGFLGANITFQLPFRDSSSSASSKLCYKSSFNSLFGILKKIIKKSKVLKTFNSLFGIPGPMRLVVV